VRSDPPLERAPPTHADLYLGTVLARDTETQRPALFSLATPFRPEMNEAPSRSVR